MDKQSIREQVWDELEESGEARFPYPPHDRIPNFNGADAARDRLTETDAWRDASIVKANPDAPQLPVRRAALHAGKTVYVAVPRLAAEKPFRRLDPSTIADLDDAATIGGSEEYGVNVGIDEMAHVDLVVSGSVAVDETGARIGKGEGYSDLEFALLSMAGHVDEETMTVTTVHERQVCDEALPRDDHDVPMNLIVTPERVLATGAAGRPDGIDWDALSRKRIQEIPALADRRP